MCSDNFATNFLEVVTQGAVAYSPEPGLSIKVLDNTRTNVNVYRNSLIINFFVIIDRITKNFIVRECLSPIALEAVYHNTID